MPEWKPIETAPKDGTDIILFLDGVVIQGWWAGAGWEVVSLFSHGCGCCSSMNEPATHWMPLPKPPEE
jgi:hypothetical protein